MEFNGINRLVYKKDDDPKVNDLFVIVQKSGNQVPYLIVKIRHGDFGLVNLGSGELNHSYKDINGLINSYLKREKNDKCPLNPIIEYFFIRGSNIGIKTSGNTFGYQKFEYNKDES